MNFMQFLTTVPVAEEGPQIIFDPMNFVENLEYMGVGMLVIFVVIGIIILSTKLINYLFSK